MHKTSRFTWRMFQATLEGWGMFRAGVRPEWEDRRNAGGDLPCLCTDIQTFIWMLGCVVSWQSKTEADCPMDQIWQVFSGCTTICVKAELTVIWLQELTTVLIRGNEPRLAYCTGVRVIDREVKGRRSHGNHKFEVLAAGGLLADTGHCRYGVIPEREAQTSMMH